MPVNEKLETCLDNDGEKWLPVALDTLNLETAAPCDLYRQMRDGEFVFFAKKGLVFDFNLQERLRENHTDLLYIRENEEIAYHQYLKKGLLTLVRDPSVASNKKAEAVLCACRQTMRRVFQDPRAHFINQACEIIVPTVDLIFGDDQATRHLVKLTSYDHDTAVHSTNVGIFSLALSSIFFGSDFGIERHRLGTGFFFHDLGKCLIPIEILNKPGPLSADERKVVNCHVMDGYRMFESQGLMTEEARTIILQHHERDDGTGYPSQKNAAEIHPYARICRLADIYEALTSDRPYHQRRTTFEALKFMKETVVTDLDEDLFGRFVKMFLG